MENRLHEIKNKICLSLSEQKYHIFKETPNKSVAVNRFGKIIEIMVGEKDLAMREMQANGHRFVSPSTKIQVIPRVFSLYKDERSDFIEDKEVVEDLIYQIEKYSNAVYFDDFSFNPMFFYAYYKVNQRYLEHPNEDLSCSVAFYNIQNVTSEYTKKYFMTWDEMTNYVQKRANDDNKLYGFLVHKGNRYILMYDDYGNVEVLKYKVLDEIKDGKLSWNNLVEMEYDFKFVRKICRPQSVGNYLYAFEYLLNNPKLFNDVSRYTFIHNVEKYEKGEENSHKVPPLYTEVTFKQLVVKEIVEL